MLVGFWQIIEAQGRKWEGGKKWERKGRERREREEKGKCGSRGERKCKKKEEIIPIIAGITDKYC